MSKLNIDQKTILELFSGKKTNFLIPDYQRPYAWGKSECRTLWDDLYNFCFPNINCDDFDGDNEEYFLGPIVTFKNDDGKMEIIDGQQRLTTLMLLLRAFYTKYGNAQDENSKNTMGNIEKCIWKTDEFDNANKSILKIDSEVANDDSKEEFLNILKTGNVGDEQKSNYAKNYRFFQNQIEKFIDDGFMDYYSYFPNRIMKNCILLPIEAESQDTALRIFSTLNDRGKPLSDADIFKAQFYKYYSREGNKDYFINKWKNLEELCNSIFPSSTGSALDEIFTRYMYYERAKQGIKSSTTEALRKFYEKDGYKLLKNNETFENLIDLAEFWNDVYNQSLERFSQDILNRLYVLNYAPNGMWTYFVSVYYMANRDNEGLLDEKEFYEFLNKITAFIWAYAVTNPGVNALRTPVYAEMINIVNGKEVTFEEFLFNPQQVKNKFQNSDFKNQRPITKSMLTWWAFQEPKQRYLPIEKSIEIEHIYARNRQNFENSLTNPNNIDSLGNKSILEKKINIRASDYRFADKVKRYMGYKTKKGKIEGTDIIELINLAHCMEDFTESDIVQRESKIIIEFLKYMKDNGLLIED